MKTKEELNAIKEEVNKVNEKICELTPEELAQVTGGSRKGPTEYASVLIGAAVRGVGVLLK